MPGKASTSWLFCRLTPMSCTSYSLLPTVRAFINSIRSQLLCPLLTSAPRSECLTTLPVPYGTRHGTRHRPPGVRTSAFIARPPNLQPQPLTDMDFMTICSLVRLELPHIRFLSVRPQFCYTLPPDPASRRRPCASLTLLLRQDGWRTSTSKLTFMPGTQIIARLP